MEDNMKKLLVLVVTMFFAFNSYAQSRGMKEVAETNLGNKVNVGKQYALFIAIDAYREWNPLKKPVSDAKEIRDILKTDYFIDEVIELYNEQATRQNIIKTFTDLQAKLGVHDSLFIYYAGHGYLDNGSGQGFWIPVDGGTDLTKQDNWLVNSQIRGYISRFKTIHVFLVSDSCFSGDLLLASRSAAPQIDNEYLRKAYSFTSRQVMTSGASEAVPDQSEFSAAFINTLRKNTDPLLCPSDIFPDLRRSVRKTMPMFGPLADARHQDGAEFIFFRRHTSVAVTPQVVQENPNNPAPNNNIVTNSRTVMSQGTLNPEKVIAYARIKNPALNRDDEYIIRIYFEEARTEGVNADFAIAQMFYLTNNMTQRLMTHNFGGIGKTENWKGYFSTATVGIRAHIQHLKAYAKGKPVLPIVDPCYSIAFEMGVSGITFEQIYGIWSIEPAYGEKIDNILRELLRSY
jgi:hypothetical protein